MQHGGQVFRIGIAMVLGILCNFCGGGLSLGWTQDRRRAASKRVHQSRGAGEGGDAVQLAERADKLPQDCL